MLTQHGLRPIVDDEDERAIAELSEEERAALAEWEAEWEAEANAWKRLAPETRRAVTICLPVAAASIAVLGGA